MWAADTNNPTHALNCSGTLEPPDDTWSRFGVRNRDFFSRYSITAFSISVEASGADGVDEVDEVLQGAALTQYLASLQWA